MSTILTFEKQRDFLHSFDSLSDRLRFLLKQANLTEAELSRRTGLSQQVCNHLLKGNTANPRVDTLIPIAKLLGITLGQLAGTESLGNVLLKKESFYVPILKWDQIVPWVKQKSPFSDESNVIWICCHPGIGKSSYAMRSKKSFEPLFDSDALLVIDPSAEYLPGQFVVVRAENHEWTIRRFIENKGQLYLKPILVGAPMTKLETTHQLFGTVVEARTNFNWEGYEPH